MKTHCAAIALATALLTGCGGGGGSTPVVNPVPTQITVDASTVAMADPGSPLPANWQTSSAFMEIFVRSYFDSNGDGIGDFQGVIQKLPYLKALGIKGIWLMPVTASMDHDHGYAVADYRATEPDYGTMADFQALVTAAHAQGIGVINDYVMNHSASQNPFFLNSQSGTQSPWRDWYIWSATQPSGWSIYGNNPWISDNGAWYLGEFSSTMPDWNLTNSAVIAYHQSNMRYWLNMGVDGFRYDAVSNYVKNGANAWLDQPQNYTIANSNRALLDQYRQRYMVCEASGDPVGFAAGSACGSAFAFGHNTDLMNAAQGNLAAIQAVAAYPAQVPATMATFLANHDSGNGQRIYDQLSGNPAQYRLAAATYLLQPGIPFIYYGEEVGMAGGQGLTGDPALRSPMSWTGNVANGGFTTGTPYRALASNVATYNVQAQIADPASIYSFYAAMLGLRNSHPAIAQGSYDFYAVQGAALSFQRNLGSDHVLVVLNYGAAAGTVALSNLPANATLSVLYPGAGPVLPSADGNGQASVSVPAQTVLVIRIN